MRACSSSSQDLGSWKEVAAYLGKGVRTVQRWERALGLPVRRPYRAARRVVYTSRKELDEWLETRWSQRRPEFAASASENVGVSEIRNLITESRQLRRAGQDMAAAVTISVDELRHACEALAKSIARPAS